MNEPEPELFVPRPGSVTWRILNHLVSNPNDEFTRNEVAARFGCVLNGVDTILQLPTSRECLVKARNKANMLVWRLGLVKRFRLDPLPKEQYIPGEQPEAVERKADGVAKWTATGAARAPAPPEPRPTLAPTAAPKPQAIVVAPAPKAPKPEQPPLVNVIGRVLGICECRGTLFVATENGVFRYNEKAGDLMHIPFAAQSQ